MKNASKGNLFKVVLSFVFAFLILLTVVVGVSHNAISDLAGDIAYADVITNTRNNITVTLSEKPSLSGFSNATPVRVEYSKSESEWKSVWNTVINSFKMQLTYAGDQVVTKTENGYVNFYPGMHAFCADNTTKYATDEIKTEKESIRDTLDLISNNGQTNISGVHYINAGTRLAGAAVTKERYIFYCAEHNKTIGTPFTVSGTGNNVSVSSSVERVCERCGNALLYATKKTKENGEDVQYSWSYCNYSGCQNQGKVQGYPVSGVCSACGSNLNASGKCSKSTCPAYNKEVVNYYEESHFVTKNVSGCSQCAVNLVGLDTETYPGYPFEQYLSGDTDPLENIATSSNFKVSVNSLKISGTNWKGETITNEEIYNGSAWSYPLAGVYYISDVKFNVTAKVPYYSAYSTYSGDFYKSFAASDESEKKPNVLINFSLGSKTTTDVGFIAEYNLSKGDLPSVICSSSITLNSSDLDNYVVNNFVKGRAQYDVSNNWREKVTVFRNNVSGPSYLNDGEMSFSFNNAKWYSFSAGVTGGAAVANADLGSLNDYLDVFWFKDREMVNAVEDDPLIDAGDYYVTVFPKGYKIDFNDDESGVDYAQSILFFKYEGSAPNPSEYRTLLPSIVSENKNSVYCQPITIEKLELHVDLNVADSDSMTKIITKSKTFTNEYKKVELTDLKDGADLPDGKEYYIRQGSSYPVATTYQRGTVYYQKNEAEEYEKIDLSGLTLGADLHDPANNPLGREYYEYKNSEWSKINTLIEPASNNDTSVDADHKGIFYKDVEGMASAARLFSCSIDESKWVEMGGLSSDFDPSNAPILFEGSYFWKNTSGSMEMAYDIGKYDSVLLNMSLSSESLDKNYKIVLGYYDNESNWVAFSSSGDYSVSHLMETPAVDPKTGRYAYRYNFVHPVSGTKFAIVMAPISVEIDENIFGGKVFKYGEMYTYEDIDTTAFKLNGLSLIQRGMGEDAYYEFGKDGWIIKVVNSPEKAVPDEDHLVNIIYVVASFYKKAALTDQDIVGISTGTSTFDNKAFLGEPEDVMADNGGVYEWYKLPKTKAFDYYSSILFPNQNEENYYLAYYIVAQNKNGAGVGDGVIMPTMNNLSAVWDITDPSASANVITYDEGDAGMEERGINSIISFMMAEPFAFQVDKLEICYDAGDINVDKYYDGTTNVYAGVFRRATEGVEYHNGTSVDIPDYFYEKIIYGSNTYDYYYVLTRDSRFLATKEYYIRISEASTPTKITSGYSVGDTIVDPNNVYEKAGEGDEAYFFLTGDTTYRANTDYYRSVSPYQTDRYVHADIKLLDYHPTYKLRAASIHYVVGEQVPVYYELIDPDHGTYAVTEDLFVNNKKTYYSYNSLTGEYYAVDVKNVKFYYNFDQSGQSYYKTSDVYFTDEDGKKYYTPVVHYYTTIQNNQLYRFDSVLEFNMFLHFRDNASIEYITGDAIKPGGALVGITIKPNADPDNASAPSAYFVSRNIQHGGLDNEDALTIASYAEPILIHNGNRQIEGRIMPLKLQLAFLPDAFRETDVNSEGYSEADYSRPYKAMTGVALRVATSETKDSSVEPKSMLDFYKEQFPEYAGLFDTPQKTEENKKYADLYYLYYLDKNDNKICMGYYFFGEIAEAATGRSLLNSDERPTTLVNRMDDQADDVDLTVVKFIFMEIAGGFLNNRDIQEGFAWNAHSPSELITWGYNSEKFKNFLGEGAYELTNGQLPDLLYWFSDTTKTDSQYSRMGVNGPDQTKPILYGTSCPENDNENYYLHLDFDYVIGNYSISFSAGKNKLNGFPENRISFDITKAVITPESIDFQFHDPDRDEGRYLDYNAQSHIEDIVMADGLNSHYSYITFNGHLEPEYFFNYQLLDGTCKNSGGSSYTEDIEIDEQLLISLSFCDCALCTTLRSGSITNANSRASSLIDNRSYYALSVLMDYYDGLLTWNGSSNNYESRTNVGMGGAYGNFIAQLATVHSLSSRTNAEWSHKKAGNEVGAVIGIDKNFSVFAGEKNSAHDYLMAIARAFGFTSKDVFKEKIAQISTRFNDYRGSSELANPLLFNGAVYFETSDALLFPYFADIERQGQNAIGVYMILVIDERGVSSVWVSDIEALYEATQGDGSIEQKTNSIVLGGRCSLFGKPQGRFSGAYLSTKTLTYAEFIMLSDYELRGWMIDNYIEVFTKVGDVVYLGHDVEFLFDGNELKVDFDEIVLEKDGLLKTLSFYELIGQRGTSSLSGWFIKELHVRNTTRQRSMALDLFEVNNGVRSLDVLFSTITLRKGNYNSDEFNALAPHKFLEVVSFTADSLVIVNAEEGIWRVESVTYSGNSLTDDMKNFKLAGRYSIRIIVPATQNYRSVDCGVYDLIIEKAVVKAYPTLSSRTYMENYNPDREIIYDDDSHPAVFVETQEELDSYLVYINYLTGEIAFDPSDGSLYAAYVYHDAHVLASTERFMSGVTYYTANVRYDKLRDYYIGTDIPANKYYVKDEFSGTYNYAVGKFLKNVVYYTAHNTYEKATVMVGEYIPENTYYVVTDNKDEWVYDFDTQYVIYYGFCHQNGIASNPLETFTNREIYATVENHVYDFIRQFTGEIVDEAGIYGKDEGKIADGPVIEVKGAYKQNYTFDYPSKSDKATYLYVWPKQLYISGDYRQEVTYSGWNLMPPHMIVDEENGMINKASTEMEVVLYYYIDDDNVIRIFKGIASDGEEAHFASQPSDIFPEETASVEAYYYFLDDNDLPTYVFYNGFESYYYIGNEFNDPSKRVVLISDVIRYDDACKTECVAKIDNKNIYIGVINKEDDDDTPVKHVQDVCVIGSERKRGGYIVNLISIPEDEKNYGRSSVTIRLFDIIPLIVDVDPESLYPEKDFNNDSFGVPNSGEDNINNYFDRENETCTEKTTNSVSAAQLEVEYCDCNPFATYAKNGGVDPSVLYKHALTFPFSETNASFFDTLTAAYATFYASVLKNGTDVTLLDEADYEIYSGSIFNATKIFYSNSRISDILSVSYEKYQGAFVIPNNQTAFLFKEINRDNFEKPYGEYVDVIARLFGFSNTTTFIEYVEKVALEYQTNSAKASTVTPLNRVMYDGAVLTKNGSFVLPYAFKSNVPSASDLFVLVIIDEAGVVTFWVSDLESAFKATNYVTSMMDDAKLSVYGRCDLVKTDETTGWGETYIQKYYYTNRSGEDIPSMEGSTYDTLIGSGAASTVWGDDPIDYTLLYDIDVYTRYTGEMQEGSYIKKTDFIALANWEPWSEGRYYKIFATPITMEPANWSVGYYNYYTLDDNNVYHSVTEYVGFDVTAGYYSLSTKLTTKESFDESARPDLVEYPTDWNTVYGNYFVKKETYVKYTGFDHGQTFYKRESRIVDAATLAEIEADANKEYFVKGYYANELVNAGWYVILVKASVCDGTSVRDEYKNDMRNNIVFKTAGVTDVTFGSTVYSSSGTERYFILYLSRDRSSDYNFDLSYDNSVLGGSPKQLPTVDTVLEKRYNGEADDIGGILDLASSGNPDAFAIIGSIADNVDMQSKKNYYERGRVFVAADTSELIDTPVIRNTYYEKQFGSYVLTSDIIFKSGKTYYTVSDGADIFIQKTIDVENMMRNVNSEGDCVSYYIVFTVNATGNDSYNNNYKEKKYKVAVIIGKKQLSVSIDTKEIPVGLVAELDEDLKEYREEEGKYYYSSTKYYGETTDSVEYKFRIVFAQEDLVPSDADILAQYADNDRKIARVDWNATDNGTTLISVDSPCNKTYFIKAAPSIDPDAVTLNNYVFRYETTLDFRILRRDATFEFEHTRMYQGEGITPKCTRIDRNGNSLNDSKIDGADFNLICVGKYNGEPYWFRTVGGTELRYTIPETGIKVSAVAESNFDSAFIATGSVKDSGLYLFRVSYPESMNYNAMEETYYLFEITKAPLTMKFFDEISDTWTRGRSDKTYDGIEENYPYFAVKYEGFKGDDAKVSEAKKIRYIKYYRTADTDPYVYGDGVDGRNGSISLISPYYIIINEQNYREYYVNDRVFFPVDVRRDSSGAIIPYHIAVKFSDDGSFGVAKNYIIEVEYIGVDVYPELYINPRPVYADYDESCAKIVKTYDGTTRVVMNSVSTANYIFTKTMSNGQIVEASGLIDGDEIFLNVDYGASLFDRKNVYDDNGVKSDVPVYLKVSDQLDGAKKWNYKLEYKNTGRKIIQLVGTINQAKAEVHFFTDSTMSSETKSEVRVPYNGENRPVYKKIFGVTIFDAQGQAVGNESVRYTQRYYSNVVMYESADVAPIHCAEYIYEVSILNETLEDKNYLAEKVSIRLNIVLADVEIVFGGDSTQMYGNIGIGLTATAYGIGNYSYALEVHYFSSYQPKPILNHEGDIIGYEKDMDGFSGLIEDITHADAGVYFARAVYQGSTDFRMSFDFEEFTVLPRETVYSYEAVAEEYSYTGRSPSFAFYITYEDRRTELTTLLYNVARNGEYVPYNYTVRDGEIVNVTANAPINVGQYQVRPYDRSLRNFAIKNATWISFRIAKVNVKVAVKSMSLLAGEYYSPEYTVVSSSTDIANITSLLAERVVLRYYDATTGVRLKDMPTAAGTYKVIPEDITLENFNVTSEWGTLEINNKTLYLGDIEIDASFGFSKDTKLIPSEVQNVEESSFKQTFESFKDKNEEVRGYYLSRTYQLTWENFSKTKSDSDDVNVFTMRIKMPDLIKYIRSLNGSDEGASNAAPVAYAAGETFRAAVFYTSGKVEIVDVEIVDDERISFSVASMQNEDGTEDLITAISVLSSVDMSEKNEVNLDWLMYVFIGLGVLALVLALLLVLKRKG